MGLKNLWHGWFKINFIQSLFKALQSNKTAFEPGRGRQRNDCNALESPKGHCFIDNPKREIAWMCQTVVVLSYRKLHWNLVYNFNIVMFNWMLEVATHNHQSSTAHSTLLRHSASHNKNINKRIYIKELQIDTFGSSPSCNFKNQEVVHSFPLHLW